MESFSIKNKEQIKKTWVKPVLDVLDIKETAYWEFKFDPETGFYKNTWVEDILCNS